MPQLPPFQEWVVQLATIISCVASCLTFILAIMGFVIWRTQLVGQRRFELGSRLVVLLHRIWDDMTRIRFGLWSTIEFDQLVDIETKRTTMRDERERKLIRIKDLQEINLSLHELTWDVEVFFPGMAEYYLRQIQDKITSITMLFDEYYERMEEIFDNPHDRQIFETNKRNLAYNALFVEWRPETDPTQNYLIKDSDLNIFIDFLEPYIKPKQIKLFGKVLLEFF